MVFTVAPRHVVWLPNRNSSLRGWRSHCLAAKTCASWWVVSFRVIYPISGRTKYQNL